MGPALHGVRTKILESVGQAVFLGSLFISTDLFTEVC